MDNKKTLDSAEDRRRRLKRLIGQAPADTLQEIEELILELLETVKRPQDETDDLAEELRRVSKQEHSTQAAGRVTSKYVQ